MNSIVLFAFTFLFSISASAAQVGDWFLDPHASIGHNTSQGTHFRLGLDGGVHLTEFVRTGVGAYYSAGERPQYDREIGAGPFVGFAYPLTSFLVFSARQDIDYVDARFPARVTTPNGTEDSFVKQTGVLSASSVGLHVFLTPNFVVSGGYRYVLGLTNSSIDDGRSATFVGFAFGI